MDLAFTPDEQAFREKIRDWVAQNLPRDISDKVHNSLDLSRDDMQRWARILGKEGWHGYAWPKQFGGPGWSAVQRHLFEEECALAGAPRIVPFGPVMVAPVIMAFGTPEQQKRHLPGIMSGDVWWSQGYSEPGSGSDLASLKCKAQRRGDYYLVNGQKTWTTLAQYGDWIFCLVRTGFEGKPQTGISFLLIDMKSPGVKVRPIVTLDGGAEVNEVWFDNVEVPADNLVGEENKGWTYAKYLLGHERTGTARIGRSKKELRRLKDIAARERVDGRRLIDDARFRDRVAGVELELAALEITNLRVIASEKEQKGPGPEASILKLRGSEIQQTISELKMQALGPYMLAYQPEASAQSYQGALAGPDYGVPLSAKYFNNRKTTIYGGSNEIQRNIIARWLGLL